MKLNEVQVKIMYKFWEYFHKPNLFGLDLILVGKPFNNIDHFDFESSVQILREDRYDSARGDPRYDWLGWSA